MSPTSLRGAMHRHIRISFIVLFNSPTLCYESWAQKTLSRLSRTEKICQLIAARVENSTTQHELQRLLMHYKVGALLPLQYWTLAEHCTLTSLIAHTPCDIPPFIFEDAEWGINMHIPEIPAFPKAMTLAATHDQALIYKIGRAIGTQCKALKIDMNLAPVVDVNGDARNPVIGMRSFGNSEHEVTTYARAYAHGLYDANILPCLKHFPGHGRTHTDPHISLPILSDTLEAQDKEEIMCPFFNLIETIPCSVMVGHIAYPVLEVDGAIRPAIVSHTIVTDLLSTKMTQHGLIVSDALNMGALAAYGDLGEIALQGLKAGIDILLCPPDIESVIQRICQALDSGEYTQAELDQHVLKVLNLKEERALHKKHNEGYPLDLYENFIQEAYDAAATAYNNFIPLQHNNYRNYYRMVTIGLPSALHAPSYNNDMPTDKPLLIALYPGSYKTHRLTAAIKAILSTIALQNSGSIVLLFGSPYCLMDIPSTLPTLILYEDTAYTHITASKIMSGELVATGTLPISLLLRRYLLDTIIT